MVPYVVTLDEAIGGSDAAVLAEHFWTGIGRGEGAASALEAALAACAPVVAEYVVMRWGRALFCASARAPFFLCCACASFLVGRLAQGG